MLASDGMGSVLSHIESDSLEVRLRATRAVAVLCDSHKRCQDAVLVAGGSSKLLAAVRSHVHQGGEVEEVALWSLRAISSCAVDHVACRRSMAAEGAVDRF